MGMIDTYAAAPRGGADTGGNPGLTPAGDVLLAEPKAETRRPSFFKVVMLNDDFTPMEFVVQLLKDVFRKPHEDAINIMLEVHRKGAGVCGVYTRDVAETKADAAVNVARSNEYPLQCLVERA